MSAIEGVARHWHKGSDHAADGAAFGSPTCNCLRVAKRMMPMLAYAHDAGFYGRGANPYRNEADE